MSHGAKLPAKTKNPWIELWVGMSAFLVVLAAAAAFLAAVLTVLLARIGHCVSLLGRRVAARASGEPLAGAAIDLTGSVLSLAQIAAIFFVMAIGTSFFFPGTGGFGSGGVDVRW